MCVLVFYCILDKILVSDTGEVNPTKQEELSLIHILARKALCISKAPVPQTDTGREEEDSKANGRRVVKEPVSYTHLASPVHAVHHRGNLHGAARRV